MHVKEPTSQKSMVLPARPVGRNFKVVRYQWGSGVEGAEPLVGVQGGKAPLDPHILLFQQGVFVYKTVNKVIPSCFRELFSLNKNFHNYSTRSSVCTGCISKTRKDF